MQQSQTLAVSHPQSNTAADRAKEMAALVHRLAAIETTLGTVCALARFQADMAHELPEEKQSITLDAQAYRGTMTHFTAQLEEAIEALGDAKAMASLLKE